MIPDRIREREHPRCIENTKDGRRGRSERTAFDATHPDRGAHDDQDNERTKRWSHGDDAEVLSMYCQRNDSGECNAEVVKWPSTAGARDSKEFPRRHRARNGKEGRQRRSAREHNPERKGSRDDGKEDAKREFAHACERGGRSARLRLP